MNFKKVILLAKIKLFFVGNRDLTWTRQNLFLTLAFTLLFSVLAGEAMCRWVYPDLYVERFTITREAEAEGTALSDTTTHSTTHEKDDLVKSDEGRTPTPPSVKIIKKVAEEEGIDWKLLVAVCMTESGCRVPDCSNVKENCDGGHSFGAFQIYLPAHPTITKEQAEDIEWSAYWTARHGKKYADNPSLFCKNHNGIGKTTNQWYVDNCLNNYHSL